MSVSTGSRRPYLALRHRDFRRLWLSQLVSVTGSQMQVVAINWHVYQLTGSPLALGAVGLTRVVPILLFSLAAGVMADRYDRRRVLLLTQAGMTLVAVALAALWRRPLAPTALRLVGGWALTSAGLAALYSLWTFWPF
jgi:MFS family permease